MNRVLRLLVTVSLVAPSFFEVRHAAQVRHVECPVDGQFEDAADESPSVPHSDSAGAVLPSAAGSTGSHRPCEATLATRQRATTEHSSLAGTPVLAVTITAAPPAEVRPSAVELYRLAPKLSPPL